MHFLKSDKNLGKVCVYTYTKDELNVYFTLQVHCQSELTSLNSFKR